MKKAQNESATYSTGTGTSKWRHEKGKCSKCIKLCPKCLKLKEDIMELKKKLEWYKNNKKKTTQTVSP